MPACLNYPRRRADVSEWPALVYAQPRIQNYLNLAEFKILQIIQSQSMNNEVIESLSKSILHNL